MSKIISKMDNFPHFSHCKYFHYLQMKTVFGHGANNSAGSLFEDEVHATVISYGIQNETSAYFAMRNYGLVQSAVVTALMQNDDDVRTITVGWRTRKPRRRKCIILLSLFSRDLSSPALISLHSVYPMGMSASSTLVS